MMRAVSEEEWRTIPSFPLYEASSLGRVRRKADTYAGRGKRPDVLAASPTSRGYLCYRLMRNRVAHWVLGHVVVCEAFHGPKPTSAHEVAHGDGDRRNSRPDNLRWATRAENFADKRQHGTHREGTDIPWAKLKPEDVITIRSRLVAGESVARVARAYGMSHGAINGIRIGRNWRHVA